MSYYIFRRCNLRIDINGGFKLKENKVSITLIIPVYNVEKYLVQCLNSVIGQSELFDEVILINDGSTDKSLSICQEYTEKYNYFKFINQENKGLSITRNIGIDYSTSEYIMFLDSDDYLRTDTVERLKNQLNKFKYDAIYFDANTYLENNCVCKMNIYDRSSSTFNGVLMSGQYFFDVSYPTYYFASACMAIYRKKVIIDKKILFPEKLYYEDNLFSFVFMIHAKKVVYVQEKFYMRRYRENSITTSEYSKKNFLDYMKIILLIYSELKKNQDIILREIKETVLHFVNDYYYLLMEKYKFCLENSFDLDNYTSKYLDEVTNNYLQLLGIFYQDINIAKPDRKSVV